MSYSQSTLILLFILLATAGVVFILMWRNAASLESTDLATILSTTTATFGTLLGIMTAGLMFTHGKFSELTSELSEKSPDYLTKTLSLEKVQSIGSGFLSLRKIFLQLEAGTAVVEERTLRKNR